MDASNGREPSREELWPPHAPPVQAADVAGTSRMLPVGGPVIASACFAIAAVLVFYFGESRGVLPVGSGTACLLAVVSILVWCAGAVAWLVGRQRRQSNGVSGVVTLLAAALVVVCAMSVFASAWNGRPFETLEGRLIASCEAKNGMWLDDAEDFAKALAPANASQQRAARELSCYLEDSSPTVEMSSSSKHPLLQLQYVTNLNYEEQLSQVSAKLIDHGWTRHVVDGEVCCV